jgi:chromosome segregation and condensation protein ScpB
MADSISSKIEAALAAATEPLSLDEICLRVFGQITERNRGAIRTNLSRLDEVGRLLRLPRKYALKTKEIT